MAETGPDSPELVPNPEKEKPTASHALASEATALPPSDPTPKGAGQVIHDDIEVKNLGWNASVSRIPQPVVGGLRNEELWTLIRRFDKQIFEVRAIDEPPLADLDMNTADDEEFSPDKLRAQLERLYMVVIVGVFSAWKHVVRLRSWREEKRTAAFLSVYLAVWLLDMVVPAIFAFLMVLVIWPESRAVCFPPAPPSLIDPSTGGVQKPPAGVLASDDSLTGAPEKHEGEAVEQEAHNFVSSISSVGSGLVVSTAAGKHPQGDPSQDKKDENPDPAGVSDTLADARVQARGGSISHEHDRTKKPVSQAVWDKARPAMHAVSDFVDTWERLGNAMSPTHPFPQWRPRLALASCLGPMILASYFTDSYVAMKGAGFAAGFAFFGDPIITPGVAFANRTYPRWQKYVELRHTILRGVPTNAQLAVTLLRVGERNKAPIPPPPSSEEPPPREPHATAGENLEHLGVADGDIHEAVQADASPSDSEAPKHKSTPARIMNVLRNTTKGGIHTALATDRVKATAGSHHARNRLGVLEPPRPAPETGPIQFAARYKGKKGHVYITATATTPAFSWTSSIEDVDPGWSMPIGEIRGVRKVGGLGWKSKLLVGWAMGSEIMDGLVITDRQGKEWHVTAVNMRDELFNRLIAMGSQMWETW